MVNMRCGPLFIVCPCHHPILALSTNIYLPIYLPTSTYVRPPTLHCKRSIVQTVRAILRWRFVRRGYRAPGKSNVSLTRASLLWPRRVTPEHNFPFHRLLVCSMYKLHIPSAMSCLRLAAPSRSALFIRFLSISFVWLLLIIPRSAGGAPYHGLFATLVVIITLSRCALK